GLRLRAGRGRRPAADARIDREAQDRIVGREAGDVACRDRGRQRIDEGVFAMDSSAALAEARFDGRSCSGPRTNNDGDAAAAASQKRVDLRAPWQLRRTALRPSSGDWKNRDRKSTRLNSS